MVNNKNPKSLQTLSTPKSKTKKITPIECLDDDDDDNETPLRPIFCLKRKSAIKEYDDKEDCFILDFNPEEEDNDVALDPSNIKKCRQNSCQDSPDLLMVAEKGQVACRDYPHSRHLCVKHPFEKTSHESYCKLCYCFVCDVAAPCKSWSGLAGHCHAIDNEGWKAARKMVRRSCKP
ncbi:hypothetical protein M8C21_020182 [Ambrosia artemisiifolia]|uniref:Uncharacterized protein n=1 Tax=Ambrosia artemisiifolia TaxID=4212 RepID=A0AAD5DBE6_AMBAR|nr:hypothetical protein M8C21_020182 [Ambrosia artemisiifolia]